MIYSQNQKIVPVIFSEAITDNATVTVADVDTKGWDYATFYVYWGTTDIAMTALKIQESDDDAAADAYADVTGLIYGTSANIAGSTSSLPGATDDDKVYAFDVDLRKTERYLRCVITVGDGTSGGWVHAFCLLSRGTEDPTTAAERGCADILRI